MASNYDSCVFWRDQSMSCIADCISAGNTVDRDMLTWAEGQLFHTLRKATGGSLQGGTSPPALMNPRLTADLCNET